MNAPLLFVQDLHVGFKVYRGLLHVLNGVQLSVSESEKVGLVGETGCGKTTIAKSILRILPSPPARVLDGSIRFRAREVLDISARHLRAFRASEVAMIFQDPTAALNPVFTIGSQLMDSIKYSTAGNGLSRRQIFKRAASALEDVSLPDAERILKCYPVQLSGGMRQRVCIALAIATEAGLLLADEPTTSLDVTIQDQVLRLLGTLVEERETSTLLITHSLGVVREWTDRVYVMYAGSIVETAATKILYEDPSHPYTRGLLQAIPKLTGQGIAAGIDGRIPDYAHPPSGCRFHPRCPQAMKICAERRPPLVRLGEQHQVACFLYGEDSDGE